MERHRRRSGILWIGVMLAALVAGVAREWHRGLPDGPFASKAPIALGRGAARDRFRARGHSGTGVPDLIVGVAVIALGVMALRAGAETED